MKKLLISSFMIIVMIILLSKSVDASDIASVSLSTNDIANKGDIIKLEIVVQGTENGIQGIQGTLKYDTDVLEYVSNSTEKDGWKVTGYNNKTGIFLAEISNLSSDNYYIYDTSSVVSFNLKIKENINIDKTKISLSDIIVVGSSNLKNTEVSKIITIRKEDNNDGDTNSNSNNSNDTTNNRNDDPTVSKVKIPKTGQKNIVTIFIITNIFLCIAFYFGYKKYKDI